ncbi:MAG: hypothetical protein J1E84_01315 [Muribaculaceae bacterium]|nr:hypothetical protein [Muribaculaceae bacterium]
MKSQDITYELSCTARPENRYNNLSHGLTLYVSSDVSNSNIYDASELSGAQRNHFKFTPTITEFVESSMSTYIRSQGITIGRDKSSDYSLKVRVKEFKLTDGKSNARAAVILDYTLSNTDNEVILQQTSRGRYKMAAGQGIVKALDKAYTKALESMDWNGIASALAVHKRADQERQRQVVGDGNTALEHTVIRWYILSTPAGADVSWRVVSSTPDVKNTNSSYVGTTPYETTESFDIRGLKFENAGNVQIEVSCEKAGYIPQKRRFNLLQAIEQKEISAKFNLVKDE